jgi:hypothetical protein
MQNNHIVYSDYSTDYSKTWIWKEAKVAMFKAIFQHLSTGTEGNHKNLSQYIPTDYVRTYLLHGAEAFLRSSKAIR